MINVHVRQRKTKSTNWEYYFNFKNKRYSKSGFPTKSLAKREGTAFAAKVESEWISGMEPKELTLKEAYEQFYELEGKKYAYNTITKMKLHEKTLEPLMDKKIKDLDYKTLQTFFNTLEDRVAESNRHLKVGLNRVFKCSMKCKDVTENPVEDIDAGGSKHKKKFIPISTDELQILIQALRDSRCNPFRKQAFEIALLFGYYMGLRIGEVMCLKKSDFDFKKKTITINKTMVYIDLPKDQLIVQEKPKTEASEAEMPIPEAFISTLKQWFAINPYELVIPDPKGNYEHPDCFSNTMRRLARANGFQFHYHLLRHLFASNLYTGKVDLKMAQEFLRHKDIKTTMNVYTHLKEEEKEKTLNSVFDSLPKL